MEVQPAAAGAVEGEGVREEGREIEEGIKGELKLGQK